MRSRLALSLAFALSFVVAAMPADVVAMCGCFFRRDPPPGAARVTTALPNKATVVTMMREGTRTVLSFQNDYYGPAEDFALVVPVPVVLRQEDVKTLDHGVFGRVDAVAAPRVVEIWESNPCPVRSPRRFAGGRGMGAMDSAEAAVAGAGRPARPAVVVEAQFAVAEYDIVVLSASDSGALEQWLHDNGFSIPDGASVALRPYVAGGSKFFVARVSAERFARISAERAGRGVPSIDDDASGRFLSPLRVHFDSEDLSLPVRLGLLNSTGEQDLVVHILAPGTRFEVANYRNLVVPTNQPLGALAAGNFRRAYARWFRELAGRNPRRVMTEFAGPVTGREEDGACLGCKLAGLSSADLDALGDDVLPGHAGADPSARRGQFVLTRLHYRYGATGLPNDLVFRTARPIQGGNQSAASARLPTESRRAQQNDFSVRFISKHYWNQPITCAQPRRGRWTGEPGAGIDPSGGGYF